MLYHKLSSLLNRKQKKLIEQLYAFLNSNLRTKPKESEQKNQGGQGDQKDQKDQDQKETPALGVEIEAGAGDNESAEVPAEDQSQEEFKTPETQQIENLEKDQEVSDDAKEKVRVEIRGGQQQSRASNLTTLKQEELANKKLFEQLCEKRWCSYHSMDKYFNKFVYGKSESDTDALEEFVKKFETRQQVEEVCQHIHDAISEKPQILPYIDELSRHGVEMVILGVSDFEQMPLFWNKGDNLLHKKKVCCYFDTSPSMSEYVPYMLHIAEFLDKSDACEIAGGEFDGKYCFSEHVEGMTEEKWQQFIDGDVYGGYGTSFEGVVRHALDRIDEDKVDIIIVFTDGYSGISQQTIEEFNQTGKRCYNIYFATNGQGYSYNYTRGRGYSWQYNDNNKLGDGESITSPLDELEGDSFTIWVPKEK
jgi:hypothetical protein